MMVKNYTTDYMPPVVNTCNDLIFLCDEEGVMLDFTEQGNSEWLAIPGKNLIGKHHAEILPPDVSKKISGALNAIRNGIHNVSFDYSHPFHGKTAWFTADLSPMLKESDQPTKYICVIREITERKEKELLLRGVLDNAFNSFIVFREIRNQEYRVVDFTWLMMNREAENFIGKTFKELQHTTAREVFDQEWILFKEYVDIAETGKTLDLEYSIFKDDTKAWLHTHVSKLGDFLIVTIKDITQKKLAELNTDRNLAEERLRASEERYRLLANNMLDLVALHEPDGTYKYLSPSVFKILGYTPEQLIGTNPYRLFHPDDIPLIQEQSHRHAKEGKEIANIEYRIRRKDEKYIWFSTNTKPIANADGQIIMLQTVSRDVTESVQTLHLLEELNREKNKLFSIIAHDLRGPLAGCIGLLSLIQNAGSETDLQKYIRLARKSAFNLHELMEDLLMWAGSQLDKISFDPTIVNVREEIEKVCRKFADIALGKDIALTIDIADDSLCVFADREMLHTITRNLLSNAIKFTPAGGQVTVRATSKDDYIEISVHDTGVGICPKDVAKLFSKSSAFTTYGTGGEKGTGLGLGICKDFVEKHKGKIWVESNVGHGSTFSFALRAC